MCDLRTELAQASLKSRLSVIRGLSRQHQHQHAALADGDHAHPATSAAGVIELDDADLDLATGGMAGKCCTCQSCTHSCGAY